MNIFLLAMYKDKASKQGLGLTHVIDSFIYKYCVQEKIRPFKSFALSLSFLVGRI